MSWNIGKTSIVTLGPQYPRKPLSWGFFSPKEVSFPDTVENFALCTKTPPPPKNAKIHNKVLPRYQLSNLPLNR